MPSRPNLPRQPSRSSSHSRKASVTATPAGLEQTTTHPTQHYNQHHHHHSHLVRASRPAPLSRRSSSYYNVHHARNSSGVATSPNKKTQFVTTKTVIDDADVDMESFLQFCATCERQITTPGNSILYCSESCRRKDSVSRSVSSSAAPSPVLSATTNLNTCHDPSHTHHDIVPQRSPTVLRPLSATFSDLTADEFEAKAHAFTPLPATTTFAFATPSWTSKPRREEYQCHSTLPSLIHSPSSSVGSARLSTAASSPKFETCCSSPARRTGSLKGIFAGAGARPRPQAV